MTTNIAIAIICCAFIGVVLYLVVKAIDLMSDEDNYGNHRRRRK